MNIRSGDWPGNSGIQLDKRIACHVNTFKSTLQKHQLGWDLIAINENEDTACSYSNNAVMSAAECFALGLGIPSNQVFVHAGLALIVNPQKVQVTGSQLVAPNLGWLGSAKRDLLAVPIRVKENGTNLLFSTTHIITGSANILWRKQQVREVVNALRGWGQPALMAGDFNCVLNGGGNDGALCSYVEQSFAEASGFQVIEHISLLKPHYIGRFQNHRHLAEFADNGCSDHGVTYGELVTGTGAPRPRADMVGTIFPGEGHWGDWTPVAYCPAGSYASGYEMRTEANQGKGDDTGLNAIRLDCRYKGNLGAGSIKPHDGLWGAWRGAAACPAGQFMTAGSIQIERPQGGNRDDTSANQVAFRCTDTRELRAPAATNWGDWGEFQACPINSAICGVSVRFEANQGGGDDTALNGLRFECCRL